MNPPRLLDGPPIAESLRPRPGAPMSSTCLGSTMGIHDRRTAANLYRDEPFPVVGKMRKGIIAGRVVFEDQRHKLGLLVACLQPVGFTMTRGEISDRAHAALDSVDGDVDRAVAAVQALADRGYRFPLDICQRIREARDATVTV